MNTRMPALFGLFALLILAGCFGPRRGDCPSGDRCLRAGNLSDPGSLDPAHTFLKQDQQVVDDLLIGLTTYDAQGEIAPGMAKSWTVSPDGLVWTFRLRPALWSDGVPVSSADFLFSFRRLVSPVVAAANVGLLYPIINAEAVNQGKLPPEALGVSAPDPQTVIIRLAHPAPYLPMVLAHYGVLVTPAHAVKRWGDRWTEPGRYVSNGPYRLVSWRLGDRIVLEKNPRFYDAAHVCLDQVEYFPTLDTIEAERQVKRGELDWNANFDSDRIRYLRSPRGMRSYIHIAPWTDLFYVVFNLRDPAFRDARVRQALAMAIDRDFIARRLLGAGQQPTDSFVPPGLGALPAKPDWADLPLSKRQQRARQLLAQAGYGPGHPLRFELKHTISGLYVPVALQADWRAIGAQVGLSREDTAVLFGDLQLGSFQAGFADWIADYLDPTDYLDLMRSDQSASNYGGYSDPTYDALLRQAETQVIPQRRASLLQRAERRMLQAAPVAPVFVNPSHNLVNPRLTGWFDNINDVHPARWMCFRDQPAGTSATR